ncbi:MAG: hypothetical protein GXY82_11465 [Methanospirillum sp.]|nr:hypothetical protein [Methanospirillum sp.]
MARCPYCGATRADGSLPCPYCAEGAREAARIRPRRYCARCGQDVTTVQGVWCPWCGFRLLAVASPPRAPVAAATPRAVNPGRVLILLFLLAVGGFAAVQAVPGFIEQLYGLGPDPSIHEPTVIPGSPPGHSSHETGAGGLDLTYTVRGRTGAVPVVLYRGVYDALPDRIVGFVGDDEAARYGRVIGEPSTSPYLRDIVTTIASMTDEPDDRGRIAVSLVQHLEYDDERAAGTYYGVRYPYETLYLGRGVCSDRSVLLAALLRELGFGVALFEFEAENHMAVGILCPDGYDYRGTGYAFIESTAPSIITDAGGEYRGAGRLVSMPVVIPVAGGAPFTSIVTEAEDAAEWNGLRGMGPSLDSFHYGRWQQLCRKYGLPTTPD